MPSPATSAVAATDVYDSGTDPFFWFGTLVNYDRDVDQEFVLVEFNALTMNVAGNQSNTLLQQPIQAPGRTTSTERCRRAVSGCASPSR